jgi:hypothetical protein
MQPRLLYYVFVFQGHSLEHAVPHPRRSDVKVDHVRLLHAFPVLYRHHHERSREAQVFTVYVSMMLQNNSLYQYQYEQYHAGLEQELWRIPYHNLSVCKAELARNLPVTARPAARVHSRTQKFHSRFRVRANVISVPRQSFIGIVSLFCITAFKDELTEPFPYRPTSVCMTSDPRLCIPSSVTENALSFVDKGR